MKIAKIATMVVLAMLAGERSPANELQPNAERTVTVCLEKSAIRDTMPLARMTASKMFADIGVTIQWNLKPDGCPAQGILLRLSRSNPHDFHPGTLAYTQLDEGARITIFYDRISERQDKVPVRTLEAHVLAHEITHVLQATRGHSDRGVMKAAWDDTDFRNMFCKLLAFTENDVDSIYRGLAKRAGRHADGGKSRNGHDSEGIKQ